MILWVDNVGWDPLVGGSSAGLALDRLDGCSHRQLN